MTTAMKTAVHPITNDRVFEFLKKALTPDRPQFHYHLKLVC